MSDWVKAINKTNNNNINEQHNSVIYYREDEPLTRARIGLKLRQTYVEVEKSARVVLAGDSSSGDSS